MKRTGRVGTHPLHETQHPDLLARVRALCLALPETSEKIAWGRPTFRVKGKLFVMYVENHHGDGRLAIWCKRLPGGARGAAALGSPALLRAAGHGPSGWIGVCLDGRPSWTRVGALVLDAWGRSAPPKLVALLDGDEAPTPRGSRGGGV